MALDKGLLRNKRGMFLATFDTDDKTKEDIISHESASNLCGRVCNVVRIVPQRPTSPPPSSADVPLQACCLVNKCFLSASVTFLGQTISNNQRKVRSM